MKQDKNNKPQPGRSNPGRKELAMTRYVVTKKCIAFGYVTIYSFSNEKLAIEKMAKLDKDPRYTYAYKIERS